MEYLLIIILQLLGIGFHVGQKVLILDKLSPDDTLTDVFRLFWRSDRITVFISGLVLIFNIVAHYIVGVYGEPLVTYINSFEYLNYDLCAFALAFSLGYCGQRLVYKWLGRAEIFLDKQIEEKIKV